MSENGSRLLVLYQDVHGLPLLYVKTVPSGQQLMPHLTGERCDGSYSGQMRVAFLLCLVCFKSVLRIHAPASPSGCDEISRALVIPGPGGGRPCPASSVPPGPGPTPSVSAVRGHSATGPRARPSARSGTVGATA